MRALRSTTTFLLCLFASVAYSQDGGTVAIPVKPAADAPQPLSPAESLKRIRLPDGFRIDLIASEPVVQEPSCIAFDEWGRLFVCELHGYNVEGEIDVAELNKAGELDKQVRRIRWELKGGEIADQALKRQYGVVKMLTDTDADGVMDKSVVWAEGLPPCYGVVAASGGIIVTCAPDILFLADTDHDGKPDVREILFTGFETEVLERGVNNPRWGIDNWIYVGSGGRGGTITGPRLPKPVEIGNTDFRIKPDGSAIEPVTGSVGTFGMTINDVGDRFPASGGRPANYALPLPHRYLIRNPHVATPRTTLSAVDYNRGFRISEPHPWRVRRRLDPEWIKFYGDRETNSNYFSGGCSNEFYGDTLFPERYHGDLFYCEPSLNIIHRCVLSRDGAGYKGRRAKGNEESEFLASTDQWFRPMNLRVGPHGSLYIVDMYREIIEDYSAIPRFLQQQYGLDKGRDRGRIWRLAPTDSRLPPVPNMAAYSIDQLVAATVHRESRWIRNTARRLLIERSDESSVRLLRTALRDSAKTPQAKINVLYTLDGLGALEYDDVLRLIGDGEYAVRIHALRLAEGFDELSKAVLALLSVRTPDSQIKDASVRLQAALSLGNARYSKVNPSFPHPLFHLAKEHGNERWMSTAILSSSTDIAGRLITDFLNADSGLNEKTQPLLKPLAATAAGQRDATAISRILAKLSHSPVNAQVACLAGLDEGLPTPSRETEPIATTADAKSSLAGLLKSDSLDVRELAVKVASKLSIGTNSDIEELFDRAVKVAIDVNASIAERRRAVETLTIAPFERLSGLAQLIRPAEAPEIQTAVILALSRSDDMRVSKLLLANWSELTPAVRKAVMEAMFARDDRLPALLDAVESKTILPNEITASQREQLLTVSDEPTAAKAKRLFSDESTDAIVQERVGRYQTALAAKRDHENGKKVFAKNCLVCHKLGSEGNDVGPDLATIANKPDETVLLDILKPSDRIEPDYRSYLVATTDGRSVTGVLKSESPTSVILAKEKGETVSILRREIESVRASDVSMMPDNLHEQITPKDLADVVDYMRRAFSSP